ncbi:MAG: hypothetical protein ABSC76_15155 [Terracidiphilus sp.]
MQQPTATTTSPVSSNFAELLAALAAPAQGPGTFGGGSLPAVRKHSAAWSEDGLEDDIATLSYERALRTHARYRTSDQPLVQGVDSRPIGLEQPLAADSAAAPKPATCRSAGSERAGNPNPSANPDPDASRVRSSPFERNLKSASITIRMSKVECAQLHRRAADAGLSVSAYLRSCTFEAESLRAMVKDTLSELRLAKAQARPADSAPVRQFWLAAVAHSMARLLSPWQGTRHVARA